MILNISIAREHYIQRRKRIKTYMT